MRRCDYTVREAAEQAPVVPPLALDPVQEPTDVDTPTNPMHLGFEQFKSRQLQLAQRYFKDAVEKSPKASPPGLALPRAMTGCGRSIWPIRPCRRRLNAVYL